MDSARRQTEKEICEYEFSNAGKTRSETEKEVKTKWKQEFLSQNERLLNTTSADGDDVDDDDDDKINDCSAIM